jgi:hypothetical protein
MHTHSSLANPTAPVDRLLRDHIARQSSPERTGVLSTANHKIWGSQNVSLDFANPRHGAMKTTPTMSDDGSEVTAEQCYKQESDMPTSMVSRRRCFVRKPPIPLRYDGDMSDAHRLVPEFMEIVNYPLVKKETNADKEAMRTCVMCGVLRPYNKKGRFKPSAHCSDADADDVFIPGQNKGICNLCDVKVWVIAETCLQIKWCKRCKNFRPWAAFGNKGGATKCSGCRESIRLVYAEQKCKKMSPKKMHIPAAVAAANAVASRPKPMSNFTAKMHSETETDEDNKDHEMERSILEFIRKKKKEGKNIWQEILKLQS